MNLRDALVLAMSTLSLAGCVHSNTAFRRTDHFDGRRFHNAAPVPPESFSEQAKLFWELERTHRMWPKHFTTPQQEIAEKVVVAGPTVTVIGHATVLLQVCGQNILTDPMFFDYVGPNRLLSQHRVTNAGVTIKSLPHIDVILISHNHYDHLDLHSIQEIVARQGSKPPRILTGLGNRALLQQHGLNNVSELDWGDKVEINGMGFNFLEAIHSSRRGLFDTDKSLWGSFLVQTPEGNIYFAGDTAYGTHFTRVYEKFGPTRLALLPIGAYKPRWFMAREHMNPEEAVRAHLDLRSRESIAIHFDTFNFSTESYEDPVNDLKAALKQHSVDAERFLILRPGQTDIAELRNDRRGH